MRLSRALALVALPLLAGGAAPRPGTPAPPADSAAVMAMLDGVLNPACPLPGVATGGQPREAHVRALAKAGFRIVLDLRLPAEPRGFDEARELRAAGVEYVRLPVTGATLDDATFAKFRRLMRDAGSGGVFVHCQSGNRVGAVMIPWLVLDRGWDLERAVEAARAGGLRGQGLEALARDYVRRRRAGG